MLLKIIFLKKKKKKLLSAIAGKDAIPPCSVFESVCAQRQALGSSVWKKIHLYFQGGVTLLGAEKWKGQNGIWPVMVWDLVKDRYFTCLFPVWARVSLALALMRIYGIPVSVSGRAADGLGDSVNGWQNR